MSFLDATGLTRYTAKIKTLLNGFVPKTTTINGIPLSKHITLSAGDVNALSVNGGRIWGDLRLQTTTNYGTKINFGDSDFVHISEPSDDCMEVKAKKVNFVLSDTTDAKFTINGVSPFGSTSGNTEIVSWVGDGTETLTLTYQANKTPIAARISGRYLSGNGAPYVYTSEIVFGTQTTLKIIGEASIAPTSTVNSKGIGTASLSTENKTIKVTDAYTAKINVSTAAYYAVIFFA